MNIARLLFKIVTVIDAVLSLVLSGICFLAVSFDKLVEKGILFSNIRILGSETFAGYLGAWVPAWILPLIATLLIVAAVMIIFASRSWFSWTLNLATCIPILYACLVHQSVILFNPNVGLLIVDDQHPITLSACCIAIGLIGLLLKIFKKEEVL